MTKYIYYIIISLLLVLIAQSVLTAFNVLINLNILLVILVFITIIFGLYLGVIWAIIIGLLTGIFSFLPIGSSIIIYLIILLITDSLYRHVLTNFSLFSSLILVILATVMFNLLFVVFSYLFYLIGLIKIYIVVDSIFFNNFIWQLLLNLGLMTIIFLISKTTIKKLNLAFLFKK